MSSKPGDKMTANEFGKLRAHLAHLGVSQAQITQAIGGNVGGRTRAEIAAALRAWLQNR